MYLHYDQRRDFEALIATSPLGTDRHFHNLTEFYYVVSGKFTFLIDTETYIVEKGDLIVIPSLIIHKSDHLNNLKIVRKIIYFNNNFISEILEEKAEIFNKVKLFRLDGNDKAVTLLSDILQEAKTYNDEQTKKLMASLFLILLSRKDPVKNALPGSTFYSSRARNILTYIQDNYNLPITLSSVSEAFHMNSSYFSSYFKKHTGLNFSEYLNKYRITKAIQLILNTDNNFTDIAVSVGFNSSNHFYKTFKSITGMSPREYAKLNAH